MWKLLALFALGIVFVGCASTSKNLQRETARIIGDIHPDKVAVSNVKHGGTFVSWEADTSKGLYSCSAGDLAGLERCVKK